MCVVAADAAEPRWRSGGAVRSIAPGVAPVRSLELLAARGGARRCVVALAAAADQPLRRELERSGVTLLRPLGGKLFFASIDRDRLDSDALRESGFIESAAEIPRIAKLHPLLAAGRNPDWAVVGQSAEFDPIVGAYVVFHPDADALTEGAAIVARYAATTRDYLASVNALVIEAPLSALSALADEDSVQWVEPALPRMSETNAENRALTQANTAQAAPYNLDGSGVHVLVYDGGTGRATHQDFGGRLTVRDASGMNNHSTHVAGTVGGDGSASGGTNRGMAPAVIIESYGFQFDGSGTFLYTNPGDIEADYNQAINTHGVDLANNSIGTNTEANGFICSLQGDYGVTSNLIDAIVRGSLGAPFRILWANGNERGGSRCDVEGFGDYYSTAPPSTAKNHITVGALNANDDSMTFFSSWGPTDDGRLKPDISAPGCQVGGDGGVTSTSSSSDTAYAVLCGTSMATPTVTGLCALLLQDWRAQFPTLADPRNSMLKALLAHNAADRGNAGPDYQFGYGSVRIVDTIDFMRTGRFREDTISHGGIAEFTVQISGGDPELKATLAWDDFPATPNVIPALVNDLDLRVFDPSGVRHFPWTLDPVAPSVAAVRTQADHINNIEQVFVSNPAVGSWRIEVVGTSVPQGPQPFSLCVTPDLGERSVSIRFPNGRPTLLAPGVGASFDVEIIASGETVVGGSPALHFRYDGGTYLTTPLASLGGDLYSATLPPAACGATPELYVSAQGTVSGLVTQPGTAPIDVLSTVVQVETTVFSDDFETNQGWTVTNISLTDGPWVRGIPVGGGERGDPATDFDGSGRCWLTDNVAGNSDVDGGPTILTSPAFDLSGLSDPLVSYAAWFVDNFRDSDNLTVEFSDDNGATWVTVEQFGDAGGWRAREQRVLDFVTLTTQFRMRLSALDVPNNSVVEAGFDAFRVFERDCTAALSDCNNNGIVDSDDIASGRSSDTNTNGVPDECEAVPALLTLAANASCYSGGQTVTVSVAMSQAPQLIEGGRFQLQYDTNVLTFVSAVPGDAPFTVETSEAVDTAAGTIDYRVDTPAPANAVSVDTVMARLAFSVATGADVCNAAGLVSFRAAPATQLFGQPDVLDVASGTLTLADLPGVTLDDIAPALTVPADISVNADAGVCSAALNPATPTVSDNCTASGAIQTTFVRSDAALSLTDPYDSLDSPITITWTAQDDCGNQSVAVQTITVQPTNEVLVDVALSPTVSSPLTRCITFELFECGPNTSTVVQQDVTFVGGSATISLFVPCGLYTCATARDALHSLRRTDVDDFAIVGTQYVADFTDRSGVGGDDDRLVNGNLNDDDFLDIIDFAMYVNSFGDSYDSDGDLALDGHTPCGVFTAHADISGDGLVTAADFTFIQINFFSVADANCCGLPRGAGGPRASITVRELRRSGRRELAVADLNHDGIIDQQDIAAFLAGGRPPGVLTPRGVGRVKTRGGP